jgi:hypothetical protein
VHEFLLNSACKINSILDYVNSRGALVTLSLYLSGSENVLLIRFNSLQFTARVYVRDINLTVGI